MQDLVLRYLDAQDTEPEMEFGSDYQDWEKESCAPDSGKG